MAAPVDIQIYPGVESELKDLPASAEADVLEALEWLLRFDNVSVKRHLKSVSFRNLFEYKSVTVGGWLRVLFGWGYDGNLWLLGAFVKHNNSEGDRLLRYYAPRATEIKKRNFDRL